MDGFENDERIEKPTKYIGKNGNEKLIDCEGQIYIVHPNEKDNFHFPYLIYIPKDMPHDTTLFVNEINTTGAKYNISMGEKHKAKETALENISINNYQYWLNKKSGANMPIFVPLFPLHYSYEYNGSKERIDYYQMLTSKALHFKGNIEDRVDNQLVKMIKDAQERLKKSDINIDDKVIMEGFSASSQFVNHFALLHPEILKLIICGGYNGALTLPEREINGEKLIFPVGIGDVPEITDEKIEEFKNIKQFYHMKSGDLRDPYDCIKDTFTPKNESIISQNELKQMYTYIGKYPNHDRMDNIQRMYINMKVNAEFATFYSDIEDLDSEHTPEPAYPRIEAFLKDYSEPKKEKTR